MEKWIFELGLELDRELQREAQRDPEWFENDAIEQIIAQTF